MQIELLDVPTGDAFAPVVARKPKFVSLGDYECSRNEKNHQESTENGNDTKNKASNEQEESNTSGAVPLDSCSDAIQAHGHTDVIIVPTISSATAVVDWQLAVPALKNKEKDRLRLLGLSADDMGFLVTRFIGHRWQFIERRPDGNWYSIKNNRHLNDWDLVRHLAGDIIVGTGCRWEREQCDFRTPYMIVDLDFQDDPADLRARYDRVVRALGLPSYVIRSSGSGGLHVYYMFARSEPLHALRTSDGRRGDIVMLLEAEGLRQENGQVEIFPRGHYRDGRGQQARVRAPFGPGSCLLHHVTLEPLAPPGPASLILARRLFENGSVSLVDPQTWLRKRQSVVSGNIAPPVLTSKTSPLKARRKRGRTKVPSRSGTHLGPERVQKLLSEGLTSRKRFNEAVVAIAFHFRNDLGLTKEEASARLLEWLESHHNGKSGTYNTDPHKARQEVLCVLSRVYQREGNVRPYQPNHGFVLPPALSEYEATTILNAFRRDSDCCDPSTGEVLDWYKLVRFTVELLRLAKQYVLGFIARCIRNSSEGTISDADLATVWPDRSKPEFIVPCPATLREGRGRKGQDFLKGIGRDTRWKLWRAVRQCGLYKKHRPASSLYWARRPATYVVRLDFGALSHSPRFFTTADSILVDLRHDDPRLLRLSKYRRAKLAEPTAIVLPGDGRADAITEMIRRTLLDSAEPTGVVHAA